MRLITDDEMENIPKLYETEEIKSQEKMIYMRFYEEKSGWEWLLMEYDPKSRIAFGLVRGFEEEIGYFSLTEMEDIPTIIRDDDFHPMKLKDLKR